MEIKQVAGSPLPERVLAAISGLDEVLKRVWIIKVIGTGFSNATVLTAEVESKSDQIPSGKYIIKIDRKKDSKKEAKISEAVATTTIANNMAHFIATGRSVDGYIANLLQLAYHTIDDATSLGSLLEEDIEEALQQIGAPGGELKKLQIILFTWYISQLETEAFHPFDLLYKLLGSLLSSETSGLKKRLEDHGWDIGPERHWLYFVSGDQTIYSNPISYAYNGELWDKVRGVRSFIGYAHGDLHLENIICARRINATNQSSLTPVLIDFNLDPSTDTGYPLYDLAYLEFSVLKSSLSSMPTRERKDWVRILRRITSSLDYSGDHPTVYFTVRHVRRIVIALQEKYAIHENDRDIEISFWISAWAAGLNFLRKQTVTDGERILALLYSTFALNRVKNLLKIDDTEFAGHQVPIPVYLDATFSPKLSESEGGGEVYSQTTDSLLNFHTTEADETTHKYPSSDQPSVDSQDSFYKEDHRKPSERTGNDDEPKDEGRILDPMQYDDIKGWSLLSEIMEALDDVTEGDLVEFRALYGQAMRNRKERSNPVIDRAALDMQYDRIMQRTEEFIIKYLPSGWSFSDLAWGRRPSYTNSSSHNDPKSENEKALIQQRTRDLFYKRERTRRRLELEKQFMGGRTVPTKEDELRKIEAELYQLQERSADAWIEVATHILKPTQIIYQDQPIRIQFIITNLGHKPTQVWMLPAEMKFVQDIRDGESAQKINITQLSLTTRLSPRQRVAQIMPPVFFSKPGKLEIMPIYNHDFKHLGWDIPVVPHTVDIHPSSPPQIRAERLYRQQDNEILIQIRIENIGQQMAYNIRFNNQSSDSSSGKPHREPNLDSSLNFLWGIIAGASSNVTRIEYSLPTTSLEELEIPKDSVVTWQDSESNIYEYVLNNELKFLDFDFDGEWPIPERMQEIKRLFELLQLVLLNPDTQSQSDNRRRRQVFLVSGKEGVGKSKFIEHLNNQARERYRFSAVHIHIRLYADPVREILKRLLELASFEEEADHIEQLIEDLLESDKESQEKLIDYIMFKSRAVDLTFSDKLVQLAAKLITQSGPLLIIINDIHKIEEGKYYDFLKEFLFKLITDYESLPFVFIITQTDTASNVNLTKDIGASLFARVNLKPISPHSISNIIDSIVNAPKLSPFLKKFVIERAEGNLQYLSLYLRWLTADGKYLRYSRNEWEPSERFLSEYQSERSLFHSANEKLTAFNALLFETIERTIPDETEIGFLLVLSVAGNDLPLILVEKLAQWFDLNNKEKSINDLMSQYRDIDVIDFNTSTKGYRFKSDLIREAIYQQFFEGRRTVIPRHLEVSLEAVRSRIIEILQEENVFDPERDRLEIAHQASKLGELERKPYIGFLRSAAEDEHDQGNLVKSINYLRLVAAAEDNLENRLRILLRLIDMYFDYGSSDRNYLSEIKRLLDEIEENISSLRSSDTNTRRIKGLYLQQRSRWLYIHNDLRAAHKSIENAISSLEGGLGLTKLARNLPFLTRLTASVVKVSQDDELLSAYLDLAEIYLAANKKKWQAIIILIERLTDRLDHNRQIDVSMRLSNVMLKAADSHQGDNNTYLQFAEEKLRFVSKNGNAYQKAIAEFKLFRILEETQSHNQKSLERLIELRDIFLEVGDHRMLTEVYCHLTELTVDLNRNPKQALDYAKRAFRYIPLVSDFDLRLNIVFTTLEILEDLNDYSEILEVWEPFFYVIRSDEFQKYLSNNYKDLRDFVRTIFAINDEVADVDVVKWNQLTFLLHQITQNNPDINLENWIDIEIEYSDSLRANDQIREAIEVLQHATKRAITNGEKIRLYEEIADIYATENTSYIEIPDWGIEEERWVGGDIPRDPAEIYYEKALDLLIPSILENNTNRNEARRIYEKLINHTIKHPYAIESFPVTYYHLFRTRGVVKNIVTRTSTVSRDMVNEQVSIIRQFSTITANYFENAGMTVAAAEVYVHSGNLLVPYVRDGGAVSSQEIWNYYTKAENLFRASGSVIDLIEGLYLLMYGYWMLNQQNRITNAFVELIGLARKGYNPEEFVRSLRNLTSVANATPLSKVNLLSVLRATCIVRQTWELNVEQRKILASNEAKIFQRLASHYDENIKKSVLTYALSKYDVALSLYGESDKSFMLMYFNDTAVILQNLEQLEEANNRYQSAVEIDRQLKGLPDVPLLSNFGKLKYQMGALEAAKRLFSEAQFANNKIIDEAERRRGNSNSPLSPDEIIHYMRAESSKSEIENMLRNLEAGTPYSEVGIIVKGMGELMEALRRWQGSPQIAKNQDSEINTEEIGGSEADNET